jgi:ABC-type lipoprotein release transport system permease subunit
MILPDDPLVASLPGPAAVRFGGCLTDATPDDQDMLVWHLASRYLRRRRIAWLALAAVMLTVAVSNVILGVMQGWLDTSARQIRAAESDLLALPQPPGFALTTDGGWQEVISQVPGVAGCAPFIDGAAITSTLLGMRDDRDEPSYFCTVDGVDWERDAAIERKRPIDLHPAPTQDLHRPPLAPDERGTIFLTPRWRAHLVLAGLDLVGGLGALPAPLPPRPRPLPGVMLGRELVYHCGGSLGPLQPGMTVRMTVPNGAGGTTGTVIAQVADTLGTGVYEIDRYAAVLPLPLAQQLRDMDGHNPMAGGRREVSGYRIRLAPGADPAAVAELIAAQGLRVETWQQRRGHITRSLEVMRNIMLLVMILVQSISIFIVYAVFSTLVAEKRHDIGVLLGLGAPAGAITRTFLAAAAVTCLAGGLLGWVLGWTALPLLDPIGNWLGVPLFPQEVIYTPDTPISYDPVYPLTFIALSAGIGLMAAALPALRAGAIDPIETLRDHG